MRVEVVINPTQTLPKIFGTGETTVGATHMIIIHVFHTGPEA